MLDHIFRGMIKTHTESEDLFVKEEMTNKMFMDSKVGFGLDLVAQVLNTNSIQSEKEHKMMQTPFVVIDYSTRQRSWITRILRVAQILWITRSENLERSE